MICETQGFKKYTVNEDIYIIIIVFIVFVIIITINITARSFQ